MGSNHSGDRISQKATARGQASINQVGGDQYFIVWKPAGGTAPAPRSLSTWSDYADRLGRSVPGMSEPLVGRDAELAELRAALTDEERASRIIVVEGAGGVGKTRLAIEAAKSVPAVLVAPTGVALPPEVFAQVPVDSPLVIIVDDADRSPDLTGLSALVNDSRFERVRLIMTMRPGRRTSTLRRCGLEHAVGTATEIRVLDRAAIDAIITGRGIENLAFRLSVIDLAQGNPLIAHVACEAALSSGKFDWTDAASLLRAMADDRLPSDESNDQHRAAAVALALLGSAASENDLAPLASAVSTLPSEPHRLSTLLDDLADAGLADAPPYTLRPALLGPVLLAEALHPQARVRLDTSTALQQLLNSAGFDQSGTINTGPVRGLHLELAATRLGPQLNALALAARNRADAATSTQLTRLALGILPADADLGEWAAVVGLASEIAPASPGIVATLYERLVEQWPAPPSQRRGSVDSEAHRRHELLRLGQRFAGLVQGLGLDSMPSPVSILLDVAWLAEPYLPPEGFGRGDDILRPIGQWCSASPHTFSVDLLFERRREVHRAVAQWYRDRTLYPPQGLVPSEAATRTPATIARVLLAALKPLLSVTLESTTVGSPSSANVLTLHALPLPDRPESAAGLHDALTLLEPLLDEPVLREPENLSVLHTVVGLPGQLRGEGARPLPGASSPLPAHAVAALDAAASTFTRRIADRWTSLPLSVRRSAAQSVLGPEPRPNSLADVAAIGDPVASAALTDTALADLLVLQPLNTDTPWREAIDQQHRAAEELGARMPTEEALALLDETGPGVVGTSVTVLPVFARAVGAAAADPEPVLDRLGQSSVAGEGELLAGLAQRHSTVVWAWIDAHATDPRLADAALNVVDEHPAHEAQFLAAIMEAATADQTTSDETALRLTTSLTWHLVRCKQQPAERLSLLTTLGTRCPAAALPTAVQAIGYVLTDARTNDFSPDDISCSQVAEVLRRRFQEAHADSGSIDFDEKTAYGAAVIGSTLPDAFAVVASEQLVAKDGRWGVPLAWKRSLSRLTPPAREQLAIAFHERMEQARREAPLSDRIEMSAAETMTVLGEATALWTELLRQWAAGSQPERQRAAAAIQHSWQDPAWAEVVSAILSAGVNAASRDGLLTGIIYPDITRNLSDAVQNRRDAVTPLLTDTSPAVRSFAADVLGSLDALEEKDRRQEAEEERGYRD
ncbi:ATP-binding protein [Streptomyces spinosisporus]|uniref:ATP-binding protein n=1 Tax=Streptomyces spinosisporus TaxID=2927582 RepID=A0ABS9XFR8_9ACTN|nr:ATP-binding protein [Streptomyces spinosisporus]MCI3240890.1 ATP-binding protein [Streptomyces spinosisporus]